MRPLWLSLFVGLVVIGSARSCPGDESLSPEQLGQLQALIKPDSGEEPWATIPWLTDLWQARRVAAERGKPILLWEMDGHPLGCT